MTRRILSTLAAVFITVAVAGPASADNPQTIANLEQAERGLEQPGTKIGSMKIIENNKKRSELQAAIAKLRAGQSVDPKEIDRLLGEARPWRE